MSASYTHDPIGATSSDFTTSTTAFIIDDDGFWSPVTTTHAEEPSSSLELMPDLSSPPPAPLPFSSLFPFILRETVSTGSSPCTLELRDTAYALWYDSQPGNKTEALEDELSLSYALCEERLSNGKARRVRRTKVYLSKEGRQDLRRSPLRDTVHTDRQSRRKARRSPVLHTLHHRSVLAPAVSNTNVTHAPLASCEKSALSSSQVLRSNCAPTAQPYRRGAVENMEKILSKAAPSRRSRRTVLGGYMPLGLVNAIC